MVPGEEDWRRVRDSVLDVLQFIFLTDRTGRFTSTIKKVRCDQEIWWVRCGFYKITGCDFTFWGFLFCFWLFFVLFVYVIVVLFCSLQSV